MHIRRAIEKDNAALTRIVQGSKAYEGDYASIIDGYEITCEQIGRDHIFLAEAQSVLGFYSLVLGETPELDLLFVDDGAQGLGLGRRLLEHMRAQVREKGISTVKIVSHPPAAPFYRRMGAIEAGVAFPLGRVTWPRPIFMLPTG